MKRMLLVLKVLTLGMLFVSSCNEPSPLGAELIEGDQANIVYTDSVAFNTTTVKEERVIVYDPNPAIQLSNFFVGNFDDPVFGNVKADIVGQLWPTINAPSFNGAIFDSLVLLLRYDSINVYGDLVSEPYNITVNRLDQNLDLEREYYSNDTFPVYMTPIGETGDFYPKYTGADTLRVVDYTFPPNIDTVTQSAHLRIHLSQDFAQELMDSNLYLSNSGFLEQINGIVVKAVNPTGGILSFNLLSSLSNMTLYYHTEDSQDTVYQQYKYLFSAAGVFFSTFNHDYSGSIVEDNELNGDSLLFIQSMSGPNIKIEVPDVDKLGDIIVNKAQFIFTYAELEEDNMEVYPPLASSVMAIENDVDFGFLFISDAILGLINSQTGNWFGGTARETVDDLGNPITTYSYNVSSYFQGMVDGSQENIIFIRAFPKQVRARRSVFYGPKNSKYPVRFELTYTKLDP